MLIPNFRRSDNEHDFLSNIPNFYRFPVSEIIFLVIATILKKNPIEHKSPGHFVGTFYVKINFQISIGVTSAVKIKFDDGALLRTFA